MFLRRWGAKIFVSICRLVRRNFLLTGTRLHLGYRILGFFYRNLLFRSKWCRWIRLLLVFGRWMIFTWIWRWTCFCRDGKPLRSCVTFLLAAAGSGKVYIRDYFDESVYIGDGPMRWFGHQGLEECANVLLLEVVKSRSAEAGFFLVEDRIVGGLHGKVEKY